MYICIYYILYLVYYIYLSILGYLNKFFHRHIELAYTCMWHNYRYRCLGGKWNQYRHRYMDTDAYVLTDNTHKDTDAYALTDTWIRVDTDTNWYIEVQIRLADQISDTSYTICTGYLPAGLCLLGIFSQLS